MHRFSTGHSKTYTRAIIGRSRFEAALVYKPRILGLKNEEKSKYWVQKIQAAAYDCTRTV